MRERKGFHMDLVELAKRVIKLAKEDGVNSMFESDYPLTDSDYADIRKTREELRELEGKLLGELSKIPS